MTQTTTAQLLSLPVSYIVETTEGTIPTTGTTTAISVATISISKDGQFEDISQIGPEDLLSIIKGQEKFETQWKIPVLENTWIQRLFNAANYGTPAGTVSQTVSFVIPIYLNGTVNYLVLKGSRIVEGSYKRTLGKADEMTINFKHTDIVAPTTSAPTGLTLASTFPSGTAYNHKSGGANPFSIGGSGVEIRECTFNVNRNTTESYTVGSNKPHSTQPHGRRLTGEVTWVWTAGTHEASYDAETAQAIALVINSTGPVTLTLSSAKIKSVAKDIDSDSTEEIVEKLSFGALSGTVTTS